MALVPFVDAPEHWLKRAERVRIMAAQADASAVQQLLREKLRTFMSDDVDIVVFGSLARREWTSGSDVDTC